MRPPPRPKEFRLETRDEVVRFEDMLESFQKDRSGFALHHVSLVAAWDTFQSRADRARVFSALFDAWLTFVFLHLELQRITWTWNKLFSKGKEEGGSILDSPERFSGKLDIHQASTCYVLRFRASLDKCMGVLVLMFAPEEYEEFYSAGSRKRAFMSMVKDHRFPIAEELGAVIEKYVTEFDDHFRTPEAHGPGVLRKWTLSMQLVSENPQLRLTGYWNLAICVMEWLGKFFTTHEPDRDSES